MPLKVHPPNVTNVVLRLEGEDVRAGRHLLVKDARLALCRGRVYGLVGRNGHGKSTLLRLLADRLTPPSRAALVEQGMRLDGLETTDAHTPLEWVARTGELAAAERAAATADATLEALEESCQRLEALDAGTARARASRTLLGLGFDTQMQRTAKPAELSGGWRTRLYLARALHAAPDLLLLDEPTNHLDLQAVLWLQERLLQVREQRSRPPPAIVVVSHDRAFLRSAATDVLEIRDAALRHHDGGFAEFEAARALRDREAHNAFVKRAKAADLARRKETGGNAVGAKKGVVKRQTEQFQRAARGADVSFDFEFRRGASLQAQNEAQSSASTKNAFVRLEAVSFAYQADRAAVLEDVDLAVYARSRIALVGDNGCGKSTLMRLLAGEDQPTRGSAWRWPHLRVASFAQHFSEDDATCTPLHAVQACAHIEAQDARELLGRFGLGGEHHLRPQSRLSGGQRARVALAAMAARRPHLLLLDEPTNNMDMESIAALAEALCRFRGAVVVVSHDQYLLERLCDERTNEADDDEGNDARVLMVGDGTVRPFEGTFAEYREERVRGFATTS